MDQVNPDQGITHRDVATDYVVCGSPCLGFVITISLTNGHNLPQDNSWRLGRQPSC
jgi:hypothetical protein